MANGTITYDDLTKTLLKAFIDALNEEGVDEEYLAKKLKKELSAKKTDTFKAKTSIYNPAEGTTTETEEVIYSKPMIAWDVRQRARKEALAYRGVLVVERRDVQQTANGKIIVEVQEAPFREPDNTPTP
jgi:hypothetical protein